LLILESCNNVIIKHWVKSLAELLNVLQKKKAFYQNNAEFWRPNLARWLVEQKSCSNNSLQKYKHRTKTRSRSNLRGLPREPNFSSFAFTLCI